MKWNRIAVCAVLCLALGLTACSQKPPQQDLTGYEALREQYLSPVFSAGMLHTSWENAEEIDPDTFPAFYSVLIHRKLVREDYPMNKLSDPIIPAAEFESNIQQYFEVSAAHLRKTTHYQAAEETYSTPGLGGATDCKVIAAEQEGKRLTLDYELILDGELLICTGTLSIDLEDDGSFRYVSCNAVPKHGGGLA